MRERPKIVIIDDDDDYRLSTRALLEGEGYEVVEARSGQEGLAAIRQHRPDLIVLDIIMESLTTGYSVNQAVKFVPEFRELGPIPILMVSAVGVDPATLYGWIGDATPITPDAYMTKPLDVPEFLAKVRQLIQK